MALFKPVKKIEVRSSGTGDEVSSRRPAQVVKRAPCGAGCTVDNHVRDWIVPLAQYKAYERTEDQAFTEAWKAITKLNPFPAISGRVCQHSCEANCNRKEKDGAVAIREMERFVGDFAIEHGLRLSTSEAAAKGKIAVVGAGPSGLTCAWRLSQMGYSVALLDAAPEAGGMMRYSISRDTIPLNVLNYEVQNILDLGIEFRSNCVVGRDVTPETLAAEYKAVIYAIGLQKPAAMALRHDEHGTWITGELPADAPDLQPATEFLPRTLNMVTPSISQGRRAADEIAAALEGRQLEPAAPVAPIKTDRMKLDWYPALERWNGNSLTATDVIAEAARCMSCGMCMDCDSCWMYCSKGGFVKQPKGEHYLLKLDSCTGCGTCVDSCPCGYLEMH